MGNIFGGWKGLLWRKSKCFYWFKSCQIQEDCPLKPGFFKCRGVHHTALCEPVSIMVQHNMLKYVLTIGSYSIILFCYLKWYYHGKIVDLIFTLIKDQYKLDSQAILRFSIFCSIQKICAN